MMFIQITIRVLLVVVLHASTVRHSVRTNPGAPGGAGSEPCIPQFRLWLPPAKVKSIDSITRKQSCFRKRRKGFGQERLGWQTSVAVVVVVVIAVVMTVAIAKPEASRAAGVAAAGGAGCRRMNRIAIRMRRKQCRRSCHHASTLHAMLQESQQPNAL